MPTTGQTYSKGSPPARDRRPNHRATPPTTVYARLCHFSAVPGALSTLKVLHDNVLYKLTMAITLRAVFSGWEALTDNEVSTACVVVGRVEHHASQFLYQQRRGLSLLQKSCSLFHIRKDTEMHNLSSSLSLTRSQRGP